MSAPAWRDAVIQYIRENARPVDKFGHQPRLYALACSVGVGMDYDDDIVFAAAWMHDLGVFIGHRPEDPEALEHWDHVPYTIARSRALLAGWGFPQAKLDAVAQVIASHQPKDNPEIPEAVVLRDADMLEQLGAIGVARAMVKVGRDSRFPTFSAVVPVLRRALENLPQKLLTSRARELAASRIEALRVFLQALEFEAEGQLH